MYKKRFKTWRRSKNYSHKRVDRMIEKDKHPRKRYSTKILTSGPRRNSNRYVGSFKGRCMAVGQPGCYRACVVIKKEQGCTPLPCGPAPSDIEYATSLTHAASLRPSAASLPSELIGYRNERQIFYLASVPLNSDLSQTTLTRQNTSCSDGRNYRIKRCSWSHDQALRRRSRRPTLILGGMSCQMCTCQYTQRRWPHGSNA
jgi:hypothetical protein